jgi:HSP20 family protein
MRLTRFEPYRFINVVNADADRPDTTWRPATDIVEYDNAFLIRLDVPGVDGSDIEITSDDGILTVSGERKSDDTPEDARITRRERVSGRFARRFRLPDAADVEQIRAQARNGILEVRIPKRPEVQPRKIEVEAA